MFLDLFLAHNVKMIYFSKIRQISQANQTSFGNISIGFDFQPFSKLCFLAQRHVLIFLHEQIQSYLEFLSWKNNLNVVLGLINAIDSIIFCVQTSRTSTTGFVGQNGQVSVRGMHVDWSPQKVSSRVCPKWVPKLKHLTFGQKIRIVDKDKKLS